MPTRMPQTMLPNNPTEPCDEFWPGADALFEVPLIGSLVFHQLAIVLSASFMCLASTISYWLILKHAHHYLKPNEQKHIIRILAMMPIYTAMSFLTLLFNAKAAIFLDLVRNCYEACVVASFFTLLCHYVAPDLHEQKVYFRTIGPKPWNFPLNKIKPPRSGLTWFNIIYVGVFQFCMTRPLLALIASITQTNEKYCPSSTQPRKAHLYIAILQGGFVLIAMYCLAQFYRQVKADLRCHGPFFKFLCIKLTLFLCFWQTWFLGLLARKNGPLRSTKALAAADIHVGIPCMLVCFEMALLACISHLVFSWKPYNVDSQLHGAGAYARKPAQAIIEAIYPWDYVKAAARGFRWLFRGVHHRKSDPSYQRGLKQCLVEKPGTELDVPIATRGRTSARSDPAPTWSLTKRGEETVRPSMIRHTVG